MQRTLDTIKLSGIAALIALLAACSTTSSDTAGQETMADTDVSRAPSAGVDEESLAAPPGSVEDFIDTVGTDRVFFEFDSHTLDLSSRTTLQRQAAWLKRYQDKDIVIEGHCDERGTREYNIALGERRANAVRNYLVALGVDPSRISTVSYGKERPVDPRSNEAAWAKNRRAVTVIEGQAGV